jgi:hypothetical protein
MAEMRGKGGLREGPPCPPACSMQVPIFIFHLNRDVAVLIDEHYNAKATENMILVVQNAARE